MTKETEIEVTETEIIEEVKEELKGEITENVLVQGLTLVMEKIDSLTVIVELLGSNIALVLSQLENTREEELEEPAEEIDVVEELEAEKTQENSEELTTEEKKQVEELEPPENRKKRVYFL